MKSFSPTAPTVTASPRASLRGRRTSSGTRTRRSRFGRDQSTFEVARWMGTSIQMIDDHYGHLAADSIDAAIDRFDRYVAADAAALRLVA